MNDMRFDMTKRGADRIARAASALAAIALIGFSLFGSDAANAQTRRAFVLGEQRYSDHMIPSLERSDADASDIAADLEQVGFDKKNITLATELRAKSDFDKRFAAFLSTVK